jgi:hypothetical protein
LTRAGDIADVQRFPTSVVLSDLLGVVPAEYGTLEWLIGSGGPFDRDLCRHDLGDAEHRPMG